jgi:hypothetical protein
MPISEDSAGNKEKFVAFVAAMMARHPEKCYASISYLTSQPRHLQPYLAFLEVLTEHGSTARDLLQRGVGTWPELREICFKNNDLQAISHVQEKLDGPGQGPRLAFGRKRGAHRRSSMRKDFGRAVFEYARKADGHGGPEGLVSKDWKTTRERVAGIRSFGPLAIFDYLERLCLLGFTSAPDEYLPSGEGPMRGVKAIFGNSQNMIEKGNELLRPLLDATGDKQAVFALETFLCCMQKERVKNSFAAYFREQMSLDELVKKYLASFGKGMPPR